MKQFLALGLLTLVTGGLLSTPAEAYNPFSNTHREATRHAMGQNHPYFRPGQNSRLAQGGFWHYNRHRGFYDNDNRRNGPGQNNRYWR